MSERCLPMDVHLQMTGRQWQFYSTLPHVMVSPLRIGRLRHPELVIPTPAGIGQSCRNPTNSDPGQQLVSPAHNAAKRSDLSRGMIHTYRYSNLLISTPADNRSVFTQLCLFQHSGQVIGYAGSLPSIVGECFFAGTLPVPTPWPAMASAPRNEAGLIERS